MENKTSETQQGIVYSTPEIEQHFRTHRIKWDHLYDSERTVISRMDLPRETRVLDVGCGCGGFGLALLEKFGIVDYTGIEINEQAAKTAREMNARARIFHADFLGFASSDVPPESYDLVASLSCIDWNVGFDVALPKAFKYVRPGGYFLASFRLTADPTIDDPVKSYQYINFGGELSGERAAYVVLNATELMERLKGLKPERISGYGYWGRPSMTAVTPFKQLCFAVFCVRKPLRENSGTGVEVDLQLPEGLL
jgi:SAM-dependent methyltransferase